MCPRCRRTSAQALVKIIRAAQIVDALFLRQRSPSNEARLLELMNDRTPLGQARLAVLPHQPRAVVGAR